MIPSITEQRDEHWFKKMELPTSVEEVSILEMVWSFPKVKLCNEALNSRITASDGLISSVLSISDFLLDVLFNEGDEGELWAWNRPRNDSSRPENEANLTKTKISPENSDTAFNVFIRKLLFLRQENLQYFSISDWTCCYWYDAEAPYSITPPGVTLAGNQICQVESPSSSSILRTPVLLKYGTVESVQSSTAIETRVHTSGYVEVSDQQMSTFILHALSFINEHRIEPRVDDDHLRVNSGPCAGGLSFSVTCYFAKRFHQLRSRLTFPEANYMESLKQCMQWDSEGGKSGALFVKTMDERYIIKEVHGIELSHFIAFATEYICYLEGLANSSVPSCLVKILGLYEVNVKRGDKKMTVSCIVMENLNFRHNNNTKVVYDLKGCLHSRYSPDPDASVHLDENFMENMPFGAIFVRQEEKENLLRSLNRDTSFLCERNIMDYSLLIVLDKRQKILTVGIIDYLRRYTIDKRIETAAKYVVRGREPTVIPPKKYRQRFLEAMDLYFPIMSQDMFLRYLS